MRIRFILLLPLLLPAFAAAQTPGDSLTLTHAVWQVCDLGDGAECRATQTDLFGSRQSIAVASYPLRRFSTRIMHLDSRAQGTSRFGNESGARIAANGSYFDMKTFAPVTFVLLDRKIRGRTSPGELWRTNGVVAFRGRAGRRMEIMRCDTADYPRLARRYRSMLAAGPMLVERGRIVEYDNRTSFYTHRHPRTLIGKRADGQVAVVVIDGRFPGQGEGATIAEAALIARQLGLVEALNLDGGGSSTLWTAAAGVVSHPCDNRRFDHDGERAVPNCIVVTPRR